MIKRELEIKESVNNVDLCKKELLKHMQRYEATNAELEIIRFELLKKSEELDSANTKIKYLEKEILERKNIITYYLKKTARKLKRK